MQIEPLTLEHKDLLKHKIHIIDTPIAEYSFANLYLFRIEHRYNVLQYNNNIYLTGITYDNIEYIMPTMNLDRSVIPDLESLIPKYNMLFPIPEEWLEFFDPVKYDISFNSGDSDYIHSIEKIGTYKGKKLHKKRNLLKQFIENYEYTSATINKNNIADCIEVLDQWIGEVNLSKEEGDYRACFEALHLLEELCLTGAVYYVEGTPVGFILGEESHESHYSIHFAKAKRGYKGIYQFIFNNYAKIMPSQFCCFNFQQDLGLDSLRQAKASYKPENIIKKYRIKLK